MEAFEMKEFGGEHKEENGDDDFQSAGWEKIEKDELENMDGKRYTTATVDGKRYTVEIRDGFDPSNDKFFEYEAAAVFFDRLGLENECKEPGFIRWLKERDIEGFTDLGRSIKPEDRDEAASDIRGYYDIYKKEGLRDVLRKAGIATAVAVSIISLITGLSLGLKRKGKDMVYDSDEKDKSGKGDFIDDLKKYAGEILVIIGDNIYLVVGGVLVLVYVIKSR